MSPSRLRLDDVLLLPRVLGALGAVTVLRRTSLSLEHLVRLLERQPRPVAEPDVERLVWLTQGILRRTHRRDFCYPRALVIFHVLSGWGCPVTLYFGVRKREGELEGHAWLDLAGRPLDETQDPRTLYHIVHSYPSTPKEVENET